VTTDRWSDWLALGAAVGLGLLSKYTMAAFALSVLAVVLIVPGIRARLASPRPWSAVALAALIFAPNIAWNAGLGFPTWRHVVEITQAERRSPLRGLAEFVAAQWGALGPLFGTLALALPLRPRRLLADPRLRWLACFAYPLLLLACVQAWRGGANANWAAPATVVAGVLAVSWLVSTGRWGWLAAGIALNVLVSVLVLHAADLLRAGGIEPGRRLDPLVRVRGWSTLADGIADHVRRHPQAVVVGGDRELLSQIAFYVRPARLAAWPAPGRPSNHYELAMPLPAGYRGDVLLVTRERDPGPPAERYASVDALGTVRARVHPDFERVVYVYLLSGKLEAGP
jgi:hypothetical protein